MTPRRQASPTAQPLFLGVDGGGTKTEAAILDGAGRVVGFGTSGPTYVHEVPINVVVSRIAEAVRGAERRANGKRRPYRRACVGLAGLDSRRAFLVVRRALVKRLRRILGRDFLLVNDVEVAFRSGTRDRYGAALVAGTGSNGYARGSRGEAWASGLGHLLSDEGAGYDQGVAALRAAAKSFDGRGPKTMLERLVAARLKSESMRETTNVVYRSTFGKRDIAALALLVETAAGRGDRVARSILESAGRDLAAIATTVIARAGLRTRGFDLVLVGSIFRNTSFILPVVKRAVRRFARSARFVSPTVRPAVGAALLAQDNARKKH